MLKVFEIDCDGVIYHVLGKDKKEAEDILERNELDWNGHLEVPRETWVTKEIEKHDYDASIDGSAPDVLGCSDWCDVDE